MKSDVGKKTKRLQETFSLGAAVASPLGALILFPFTIASSAMTVLTRGVDELLIDANTVTAWSTGTSGVPINWFTIEDTVFGEIELFDADYFNIDKNNNQANKAIKNSVAVFYYVTRVIAVVMGLIMLIYLGIRMALSTIASDVAKYKDMLKDWLVSMILIFAMPYIIGIINMIAGSLTELFALIKTTKGFEQSIIWQSMNLLNISTGWSYIATVCMYIVITVYQIKFFMMYMNRFLAMGFLIVISPLITVTYSATKTKISGKGDKAAAFDTWLQEYMVNAFLMPLHAGIYMVFIVSANEIFKVAPFLAVIFFAMLSRAERIVKNILGMRKKSSIHSMAAYMPIGKKSKG